jgi:hypothetical protein
VLGRDNTAPRGQGLVAVWLVMCDCGKSKTVSGRSLTKKLTRSCGCLRSEPKKDRSQKQSIDRVRNYGPAKSFLRLYKYQAAQRGNEWGITEERFLELIKQHCHYCDSAPVFTPWIQRIHLSFAANGIDRMDNSKGYVEGNVVACCKICNRSKLNMKYADFLSYLEGLIEKRGSCWEISRL